MPKQTSLESLGSGEGQGLTTVPGDATKDEVHGWVNHQLQGQLKPEGLAASPLRGGNLAGRKCKKLLITG